MQFLEQNIFITWILIRFWPISNRPFFIRFWCTIYINNHKAFKQFLCDIIFVFILSFKADFANIYWKNKDLSESLPLTPPLSTRVSLGIEKEKFWGNLQYNLVSKQDNISRSFGETETSGYQTLDIRLGLKTIKNITLGVAVINIFDEAYNSHLNFSFTNQENHKRTPITEPIRNFSVFVQYKF